MTKLKKWLLIVLGFGVSILIGVVGGMVWAKRRVIVTPNPEKVEPSNFVVALKAKKEKINEQVERMGTDELIDDINDNYE